MIKRKPLIKNIFTADPSAHVFENKIYIYPSHDLDIDADVNEGDSDLFSIFSAGFYYNYKVDYGYYVFDLCYGAMAVGSSSMTIFVPSVEFRRKLTNRIFYLFEIQYPIANDWIVDLDFEENYTSFSLSSGIAFIF